MSVQFRGRQTQFYIDFVYGIAFSVGFGYLLFVGMDARVAAFQGGLVLGYFLRVWENMTVYERILEEEIAAEAEEAVAEEVAERVPGEAQEQVAMEVEDQVEDEVTAEVEQQVADEVTAEVEQQFEDEIEQHVEEEIDAQIDERVAESMEDGDERRPERRDDSTA